MARRDLIGTVVCIETDHGLVYAQVSHFDEVEEYILRILPGHYREPVTNLEELVAEDERFHAIYPVPEALRYRLVDKVGRVDVPVEKRPFPTFRSADLYGTEKDAFYWMWNGTDQWRVPESELSEEDLDSLSPRVGVNHESLLEKLQPGWSPRKHVRRFVAQRAPTT